MQPLDGLLVVGIEQAVAAPLCTARLREAGARVIKIERGGGDFARGYDAAAHGDSSYFVWLNQGKESLTLDFKQPDDAALLHRMLARADVLVQNLAPRALQRAGFGSADLRARHPRLITCDISGYGEDGAAAEMKAYDFLVQAESGLLSVSGGRGEGGIGRIGVSICDLGAGAAAHAGVLEALLARAHSGRGAGLHVSLFDVAAEWMSVPLAHYQYGGGAPGRIGLHHPSIAPYGGYDCADGMLIIAIQNEREWRRFCECILMRAEAADNAAFAGNNARVKNRADLDEMIVAAFSRMRKTELTAKLRAAGIAHASINGIEDLAAHPALRLRNARTTAGRALEIPARPIRHETDARDATHAPRLGQHNEKIRREFCDD